MIDDELIFGKKDDAVESVTIPNWDGPGERDVLAKNIALLADARTCLFNLPFPGEWYLKRTVKLLFVAVMPGTIKASIGSQTAQLSQSVTLTHVKPGSAAFSGVVEFEVAPIAPYATEQVLTLKFTPADFGGMLWLPACDNKRTTKFSYAVSRKPQDGQRLGYYFYWLSRAILLFAILCIFLGLVSKIIPEQVATYWHTVVGLLSSLFTFFGIGSIEKARVDLCEVDQWLLGESLGKVDAIGARRVSLRGWILVVLELMIAIALAMAAAWLGWQQLMQYRYQSTVIEQAPAEKPDIAKLATAICVAPHRAEARMLISAWVYRGRLSRGSNSDAFRTRAAEVTRLPGLADCVSGRFDYSGLQRHLAEVTVSDPLHWYAGLMLEAGGVGDKATVAMAQRRVVTFLRAARTKHAGDALTEIFALIIEGEYFPNIDDVVTKINAQMPAVAQQTEQGLVPPDSHIALEIYDRLGQYYLSKKDAKNAAAQFNRLIALRTSSNRPTHSRWDRPPEKLFLFHIVMAKFPPEYDSAPAEILESSRQALAWSAFRTEFDAMAKIGGELFSDDQAKAKEAWTRGYIGGRSLDEISKNLSESVKKGWDTW